MELIITLKGSGKYAVTDPKGRNIYSVTKKRKLVGNPITTLHDASGYALYTLIRTESGRNPAFQIVFNDSLYMTAQCTSMYVDPCVRFEGDGTVYELKGKMHNNMKLRKDGVEIGGLTTEALTNGDPRYSLIVDNKYFDDIIPLFVVIVDKCFNGSNK